MFIKIKKAIAPVVATSILIVVVVISIVGFQGWFDTFSSNLFIDVESDSSVNSFVNGIETVNNNGLYIKAGKNLSVNSVEINGIDCNVNGSYSGLSKIDISLCLSQISGSVADVVLVTDSGIYEKKIYIDQSVIDGAVPSSTEIISLNSDILLFQSNYSDLTITDITIGGNSVITYPQTITYDLDISSVNNFDTYSCNSAVAPTGGLDEGIFTLTDLGFDFPFFSFNFISGTDFYVDTNGKISTSDSNSNYGDIENSFINHNNIAPISYDLLLDNMYVCPDQGTSPDKYSVIKFIGNLYGSSNTIDNEVILRENGNIEFHYGGLVDVDKSSESFFGITDGSGTGYDSTYDIGALANTTRIYSRVEPNKYKNLNSGIYNIDLSELGILDLTNGNHEFVIISDKGNFNKTLDVGTLFDSCSLDSVSINHTKSATFYNSLVSTYPTFCQSEVRTCRNGVYDGNVLYQYSSCNLVGFPNNLIFSSKWNTSADGTSSNNQIKLPLKQSGTYSFEVKWGDGNIDLINSWDQEEITHTYATAGEYYVNISGLIDGFGFGNGGSDSKKILEISQWGNLKIGNEGATFYDSEFLNVIAVDTLNTTGITNFKEMFFNAQYFNQNINDWDTSLVTDMSRMFGSYYDYPGTFNYPLNNWDTSLVTDMSSMFSYAQNFNQDISNWDVSSVTNMRYMFAESIDFNMSIDAWNVSSVIDIVGIFSDSVKFNQPLNNWDISSITSTNNMFYNAASFNQPLSNWDTSLVTSMDSMFRDADKFNQDISSWDVSSVITMTDMFRGTAVFNQPLNNWNVSSVTDMGGILGWTVLFDQPLNNWDVSSVTNMRDMFYGAYVFNQPLNNWDTSSVTSLFQTFGSTKIFNQDISSWNVSSVTGMSNMFNSADVFNSPLNNWDTSSVTTFHSMFSNADLFNQPLDNWDTSSVISIAQMFSYAIAFNQPLNSWNTSSVTDMLSVFRYMNYNYPLNNWDTSSVISVRYMFKSNPSFNQDVSMWNVSSVADYFQFDDTTNAGWIAGEKPTFP